MRHTRPNWYKKYHQYPIVHYFHFAALVILMSVIGFGLYRSFVEQPQKNKTLAAPPTAPPRILSFQGRLTDSTDTPITSATPLRFAIYNHLTASGSALLWQEIQTISPDTDGVFSVLLGTNTSIPSTVFTDNSSLYLGVTVTTDPELTPRQQIATVAFAANAETLQGLLPITASGATQSNVVLALDSSGDLTIGGSATPTFSATGGEFTLSGNVLSLTTTAGSNANINISPDGRGGVNITKPLQNISLNNNIDSAAGAVEIDDLFAVLATSSGQSAFTLNQNGSGPLISASSSGIARFTVSNDGSGTFAGDIAVNGGDLTTTGSTLTINMNGGSAGQLKLADTDTVAVGGHAGAAYNAISNAGGSPTNPNVTADNDLYVQGDVDIAGTLYVGGSQLTPGALVNYWQRNTGALSPSNITDDLLIGGIASSSASFRVSGLANGTIPAGTASTSGHLTFANSTSTTPTINVLNNDNFLIRFSIGGDAGLATEYTFTSSAFTLGNNDLSGVNAFTIDDPGANEGLLWNAATVANDWRIDVSDLGRGNTDGNLNLYGIAGGSNSSIAFWRPTMWVVDTGKLATASASTTGINFTTSQNMHITFNQAGNVGIGTTLPAYQFEVEDGSGIVGRFSGRVIGGNAVNSDEFVTLGQLSGGAGQYWQRNQGTLSPTNITDDVLVGGTATSSALIRLAGLSGEHSFFNTGGNVGIGTTSPTAAKLQINASGGTAGLLIGTGNGTDSNFRFLPDHTDGYNYLQAGISSSDTAARLRISRYTTANSNLDIFEIFADDTIFSGGNVGIGSTAPIAKLDVAGNTNIQGYATVSASLSVGTYNAPIGPGNAVFSGNVGIGTSTTSDRLRVSGGNIILDSGAANSNYIGSSAYYNYLPQDNGGRGGINTASSFYINLDSNNDGTTGLFQVAKDSNSLSGGTQLFTVNENGNVGIGTTTNHGFVQISGGTQGGNAALVISQTGSSSNDIFSASQSGTTRFTLAGNGSITQTSAATTGNAYTLNANSLTTGTGIALSSTSTSLSSGSLMTLDWSPGSSTTSTGDLLSLNIGANGTLGKLFNIKDAGSSIFSVSESTFETSLPVSFTSPGDVSIAYDLLFTNPTASYVKSSAPLYIQAGETFNSSDLTLQTYNAGNVIIDSQALVANQAATVAGQLVVGTDTAPANIGNFYLTNSSTFGKALAIFNQTESQDIFTASASGTPKFTVSNTGSLTSAAYTTAGGIFYSTSTGLIQATAAGTGTQCLLGGSTPTWGSCASGGGITGSGTTNYLPKWNSSSSLTDSTIFDNGNVGIGTTVTTAGRLVVNGTVVGSQFLDSDNTSYFIDPAATATALNVAGSAGIGGYATVSASLSVGSYSAPTGVGNAVFSGNVGIGTTALTAKLQVASSGQIALFGTNGNTDQYITVRTDGTGLGHFGLDASLNGGNGGYILQAGSNKTLNFVAGASDTFGATTPQMVLDTNGNLGIGNTAPTAPLYVNRSQALSGGSQYGIVNTSTFTGEATANKSSFGTYNSLSINGNDGPFSHTGYGNYNILQLGDGNSIDTTYGVYSQVQSNSTLISPAGNTASTSAAFNGAAFNNASGTITTQYGGLFSSYNNSTGTVTSAYGIYGQAYNNNASGTLTTAYGARTRAFTNVANASIPTAYGLYADVATASGTTTGGISTAYGVYSTITNPINSTAYGVYSNVTGVTTGTNYGLYVNTTGSVTNNYGIRVTGTPAANGNYALYVDAAAQNYFNGNVGIGTTLPSAKLNVVGTLTQATGQVTLGGNVDATSGLDVTGASLTVGGVTTLTTAGLISSNTEAGNLNLGCTGSSCWTNANGIVGFTGTGSSHGQLAYYPGVNGGSFALLDSSSGTSYDDKGALSLSLTFERLWAGDIISDGNIGIGSTAPTAALDVVGAGSFSTDLTVAGGDITGANGAAIDIGEATSGDIEITGDLLPATDATYDLGSTTKSWRDGYFTGQICFDDSDCATSWATVGGYWQRLAGNLSPVNLNDTISATTSASVALTITQTGAFDVVRFEDQASDTSPFIIKSDGNVGIGTTTPGNKLGIYDGSNTLLFDGNEIYHTENSSLFIKSGAGTTFQTGLATSTVDALRIEANGNIGIGTTIPQRVFHVVGDAMRFDRDSNSASIFLNRTSGASLWKGFQFGTNASGSNNGEFFISDMGTSFTGSGTRRLTINNTGNIGIGTITSPIGLLNVDGAATGKALVIFNQDGGNQAIFTASKSGTTKFLIDTNGNVGIGTTTITTGNLFDIGSYSSSSSTVSAAIIADTSNNTELKFREQDNTFGASLLYEGTDNQFQIRTFNGDSQGSAALTLSRSSGNIAIGTTSTATFKLRVDGSIGPDDDDSYDLGSSTRRWRDLYLGPSSLHLGTDGNEAILGYNTTSNFLGFDPDGDSSFEVVINDSGNIGIGNTNPATFPLEVTGSIGPSASDTYSLGSSARLWDTVYVDQICFDGASDCASSGGALGTNYWARVAGNLSPLNTNDTISATTSASTALTITQTGAFDVVRFEDQASDTSPFIINQDGNVGIGTTSPGYKLDVTDRIRIRQGGAGSAGIWFYQTTPAADRAFVGMASDSKVGFWGNTGAGWGFVMDTTTGNVGIGTTTPTQKLHVEGNTYISGNVGIGTTSPAQALHVIGNIRSGSYANAIGTGSTTFTDYLQIGGTDLTDVAGLVFGVTDGVQNSRGWIGVDATNNKFLFDNTYSSGGALDYVFRHANSDLVTIKSGGNVGIGSTAPTQKLDVAGGFLLGNGSSTGQINTSDWDISTTGALTGISGITNDSSYTQSGTATNTFTGDLSLGTGAQVDFADEVGDKIYLWSTSYGLGISSGEANWWSGGSWSFRNSSRTGTEVANISSAGNLQIDGDLTISGGNVTSATTFDSTLTATGTLTANGTLDANGLFTLGDNGDTGAIDTSDWDISTTGDLTGIGALTMDGNFSQTGVTTFSTGTGAVSLNGAVTAASTLTVTGNLDINGTSNDIAGTLNLSGDTLTSSTDLVIDPAGGGVKIGTGTPNVVDLAGDDLYVTGDLEVDGTIYDGSGNALTNYWSRTAGALSPVNLNDVIAATTSATTALTITQTGAFDVVRFEDQANDTSPFVIAQDGNVGIGSTSPSQKLDVSGIVQAQTSLYLSSGGVQFTRSSNDLQIKLTNAADIEFYTSNTQQAVIDANGNLGVGTTTPTGKFNVDGAVTGKALAVLNQNGGDQAILTASKSGVTKFIVDTNGNVGIGTASPAVALNVVGSAEFRLDGTGSSNTVVRLQDDGTETGALYSLNGETTLRLRGAGNIYIDGGGVSAGDFTVASTGNVGIGSTAPGYKLDVNGSLNTTSLYLAGTQVTSTATELNILDGATLSTTELNYLDGTTVTAGGVIYGNGTFLANTGAGTSGQVLISNGSGAPSWADPTSLSSSYWQRNAGALSPKNITDDVLIGGTATSSAIIRLGGTANSTSYFNTGGNVGIGLTNPSELFTIYGGNAYIRSSGTAVSDAALNGLLISNGGSSNSFHALRVVTSSGSIEGLTVTNAGNVGLGSTTPTQKLDVVGNIIATGNIGIATTTVTSRINLPAGTTAAGGINFGGDVDLFRGAANRLDLASGDSLNLVSGNLQVAGTTVVTSGRIVQAANGTAGAPAFTFSNDTNTGLFDTGSDVIGFATAGSERMRISSTGNVGIGTTSNSYKLAVAGSTYIEGRLTATDPSNYVVLGTADGYSQQWAIGQNSRNQMIFKNKDSNTTFTGTGGTASITNLSNTVDGDEGTYATVTIASTSDTAVAEISNSVNYLNGSVFSQAAWWPSITFRSSSIYAQSITVEARYDGDGGAYQTVWSTTTNTSPLWQGSVTVPSGIISPYRISALRITMTNWTTTGNVYIPTIGLHHRSEEMFPQYANRLGTTLYGTYTFSNVTTDITTGTNEHFAIVPNGTGNVGIGSTAPTQKLDVAGGFKLGNNSGTGQIDTSDWDISTTGALTGISGITNDSSYTQSGTATNTFTGDLSLGTGAQVDFADEVGDKIYLYSTSYGLGISSSEANWWSGGSFSFRTNSRTGTEIANISSTGNLQIDGDFTVSGGDITGVGTAAIDLGEATANDIEVTGDLLPSADATYDVGSTTKSWRNIYLTGNLCFDDSNCMSGPGGYWDRIAGVLSPSNLNDVIAATTSATTALTITQTGAFDVVRFEDQASDTSPFIINQDGNVGIGTTNAVANLHVEGPGHVYEFFRRQDNNYNLAQYYAPAGAISTSNVQWLTGMQAGSNTFEIFYWDGSNNNTALAVLNNGNVGIGTTAPTGKVHIQATTNGKGAVIINGDGNQTLLTASTSGSTKFLVDKTGNVGIGVTDPGAFALNVNGNTNITGNLDVTNGVDVTGANLTVGGSAFTVTTAGVITGSTATLNGTGTALTLSGAATTAINISNTGVTTDINLQNSETIDNNTDDFVEFQGVGGADNTDLAIDLDGTHPVLSSPTDGVIELAENVDVTNGLDVTGNSLTVGGSYSWSTLGVITATTDETINGIDVNAGALSDVVSLTLTTAGNSWSSGNIQASGTLDIAGATTLDGDVTIGDAITDNITFTGRVAQDNDLIPITTTGTNDLGSASLPWDTVYANDVIVAGSSVVNYWARSAGVLSPNTLNDVIAATTSATTALTITQTGAFDVVRFEDVASDTTPVVINQNGNFGVGTTNPTTLFYVAGNGTVAGNLDVTNGLDVTGNSLTVGGANFSVTTGGVVTGVTATLTGTGTALTLSGAATTAINITNTGVTTDINLQNSETIDNNTDDFVEFQGAGGADNTDLAIDLDGTHPVLNSPTDTTIELAENVDITNGLDVTGASLTVGGANFSVTTAGVLTAASTGAFNGVLQVGSTTPTTFSRFGTGSSGNGLSGAEDVLISGDLEVNGTIYDSAGNAVSNYWSRAVGNIYPYNLNDTISATSSAGVVFTVTGTRTGAGNIFLVEDQASDASPFAINEIGDVTIGGDLAISGGNVTSATTFDSTLTVTGTFTANGTLDANGLFTLGDNGDTGAIDTTNWDVTTTGDISTAGDLALNGGDLTSTATTFNFLTGSVTTLNLADIANTKTIDIGGVTNSGTDTINIATNSTASDVITIGNSNTSTTIALTGGNDWSITAAGVITGLTETLTGTGNALTLSGAGANIAFSGAGLAQITTAASQHLALVPGGNVGIGLTTPTQGKLTVLGRAAAQDFADYDNTAYFLDPATASGTALKIAGSADIGGYASVSASLAVGYTNAPAGPGNAIFSGNVGIGTTVPLAKLDVSGTASISGDIWFHDSAGSLAEIVVGNGDDFYIRTSVGGGTGSVRLAIDNGSGNIGIGTTSPNDRLSIAPSGELALGLYRDTYSVLRFRNAANSAYADGVFRVEDFVIETGTTGSVTERVRVLSNGNVGIGTSAPGQLLEVESSGTPVALINGTGNRSSAYLYLDRGSGDGLGKDSAMVAYRTNGTANWYAGLPYAGGAASPNWVISTDHTLANSLFVLTSAGNVGIGTTNPLAKLALSGGTTSASLSADLTFWESGSDPAIKTMNGRTLLFQTSVGGDAGTLNRMAITSNGNVGIGTTAPSYLLEVNGSSRFVTSARFESDMVFADSGATTIQQRNGGSWRINVDPAEGTGTQAFRVWGDGVVQIGSDATDMGANLNAGDFYISDGSLCVSNGTDDCDDGARTDGNIYAQSSAVTAIDVAENYPSKDSSMEAGDLVVADPDNTEYVKKSSGQYQPTLLGVISTKPGILLGGFGDEAKRFPDDQKYPIALAGRIPTKVSTINGPIKRGDFLTSSPIPGVAMKATNAGQIVAKALEDYTNPDPNAVGKVIAFVNVSWHDPQVFIANSGDLNITGNAGDFKAWVAGQPVERKAAYADAVIARLTAGITRTKELIVEGPAQFLGTLQASVINAGSLAVNNVTVAGQSLRDYIIAVVSQAGFTNNQNGVTSPIASIDRVNTDLISPLSDEKIEIAGDVTIKRASTPATLTVEGDASISGKLATTGLSAQDATIAGTLRANRIIADQIEGLDARIASLAANTITATNAAIATNSVASDSGTLASGSATIASLTSSTIVSDYASVASFTANLAFVPNLNAEFGTFEQGLMAFGPSSLSDVSVAGQLSVNGSMIFAENSINTLGSDLEIQPLRQGNISFMAGLVTIDIDGNMSVGGNATFAKDVRVNGTLSAKVISPVPDEDLVFKLPGSSDDTQLAVDRPGIVVQNASGSGVLKITDEGDIIASGEANFKDIAANTFKIIRGAQADTSLTQTVASASAGTATIKAGQFERTVISPFVSEKSLIYITPVTNTNDATPYIARQTAEDAENGIKGSFTIRVPQLQTSDVKVNWWIIN